MGPLWPAYPPSSGAGCPPSLPLLTICLTVVSPLTSSWEHRCSHTQQNQNGPSCARPWEPSPGLEWFAPEDDVRPHGGSVIRTPCTKADFTTNKNGKLVSRKQHAHGKTQYKNIRGWTQAVSKARKALGITGFCAVKKGTPLYKKAREFYSARAIRRAAQLSVSARPPQATLTADPIYRDRPHQVFLNTTRVLM